MKHIALSVLLAVVFTGCGDEDTQDDQLVFDNSGNANGAGNQTPSDGQTPSTNENVGNEPTGPNAPGACPEVIPTLVPARLPAAVANVYYEADMNADGLDQEVIRWSISSGVLPAGLTLNALTGTLSGMSAAAGTFNFEATIEPRDLSVACPAPSASIQYTFTISAEPGTPIGDAPETPMDGQNTNPSEDIVNDDDAECQVAADCPAAVTPRCNSTCNAGVCGTTCDVAVPAEGPACPADPAAADYCATACSFFALCGVDQCAPLQEDSYVPLYEGCIEDQCGQAGLICLQQECTLLVSLAKGVSQRFADVCDNGYQGD